MSAAQTAVALRAWRREGGTLRVRVVGWSMAPLLHPGDLIEVEPCPAGALRAGDLVLVRQGGGLLAHRLLRAAGPLLLLRGDALPAADPPIPGEAALGRVLARERGGRRVALRGLIWTMLGRALAARGPRAWRLLARSAAVLALASEREGGAR